MYVMPKLEQGDSISWYPEGEPAPGTEKIATCLQVEGDTIVLQFQELNRSNFQQRECVRHISDPWLKEHPHHKSQYGAWDYSPQTKRLMALEDATTKPKGK
jgi:hypothetical protein